MQVDNQPPITGPGAIAHALSKINLDGLQEQHRQLIRAGAKSKRTKSVHALNVIEGLKRNGMTADKLLIQHVPVIPPAFRPFSVVGNTFVPGDANELYRDLFQYRDMHDESMSVLGDAGSSQSKLDLYDTVKALYGYGEPIAPKTKQRGVSGFLQQITGNNPKYCYDKETEILTRKNGWVLFKELPRDTEVGTINPQSLCFEWQQPEHYFDGTYDGEMVRLRSGIRKATSERMDLLVTPDHRMWSRVRRKGFINVINNTELERGWAAESAVSMLNSGQRRHIMIAAKDYTAGHREVPAAFEDWPAETFAAWLGWWIAEGSAHECGSILSIFQSSSNSAYCDEINLLFDGIAQIEKTSCYTYNVKINNSTITHWNILNCKDKVDWIRDNVGLGSDKKRIPLLCKDWNTSLLKEMLNAYLSGDGNKRCTAVQRNGGQTHKFRSKLTDVHTGFTTTSKGLFDDLMEIGFKLGLCIRQSKGPAHYVTLPSHHMPVYVGAITGRWACQTESNNKKELEYYKGTIHCCSVPNGLLVVRRNGAAVVSGNSYFQRKLISKPQDSVSRGTIAVDPELSLDEIGVPLDMAWVMYAPYIQRRLVQHGMSATSAITNIRDRTDYARKALDKEVLERPVIYSRAPSWHKFNVLSGRPKLIEGNTIAINPLVTTGLNADFDGDAMNLHVPSQQEAVKEAWDKLMPSKMLFSIRNPDQVVPIPKQELILGLYAANRRQGKNTHTFDNDEDALKAIRSGAVGLSDDVQIKERQTPGYKPLQ